MTSTPFFLHRIDVDLGEIARQSGERGWSTRRDRRGRETAASFDEGTALHHLLTELFGPGAVQPFRLMVAPRARCGRVYGYSAETREALLDRAGATAMPETERAVKWRQLGSRQMPENWCVDRRLGFDLRVRPIRRVRRALEDPTRGVSYREGAEIDAFRLEALRRFPDAPPRREGDDWLESGMAAAGRTREAVYSDWLAERLGAIVELGGRTRLVRFERRCAARKGCPSEGPDAVLQGELVIRDPDRFARLLADGVGRHKTYGYGMMLLRPPAMFPPES